MIRDLRHLDNVPTSPASEHSGFGTLECSQGRLPLVAMDVRASITDLTAATTIRQTYCNSLSEAIEATYIFPLPDRAAVTHFKMHVADRTIEGVLKERQQARDEYDEALASGHRAAIAEEERSGVFTLRVGNIPPNQTATVELQLVGPLPVSGGEATFRFPLVVAPRYTSGIPLDGQPVGDGVTLDTDQVPDASRVTPPVLLPGFPNPVRLSLQVTMQSAITTDSGWRDRVACSLHSTVVKDGPPFVVALQPGERLDRDFILRFPIAGKNTQTSLTASATIDGRPGVFALTLFPPEVLSALTPAPRKICFVLDHSGSMGGWKMVAARRAVGRMIDTLLDVDEFNVLAFDDCNEEFSQQFVTATDSNRWQALEWLGKVDARGGTELGGALNHALQSLVTSAHADDFEQTLVIVTDGQVTGEDIILRQTTAQLKSRRVRIFTVGIDQAVNAGFLNRLAGVSGGQCELVESEGRLDAAMDTVHHLIGQPVLTDIKLIPVDVDLVADSLTPSRLPDLFPDRPVTIFGRHLSRDGRVKVRVTAKLADGSKWESDRVCLRQDSDALTAMWGRSRVRDLEDAYATNNFGSNQEFEQRIVAVSLESRVLSRFTAYVAVDNSEVINDGGRLYTVIQPVEIPRGFPGAALFCMMPASLMRAGRTEQDVESVDCMLREFLDVEFDLSDPALADISSAADEYSPLAMFTLRILEQAVQHGASELLIELGQKEGTITSNIGGALEELQRIPAPVSAALIARLRVLAGIADQSHDRYCSGEFCLSIDGKQHSFRMIFKPTSQGSNALIILQNEGKPLPKRPRAKFWA